MSCRVADPDRKGTVERAIQHTQDTALKGRRFESIEEQNAWLAHWEERWAAPRIHGRKKRQVLEMFAEEKPQLRAVAARAASATSRKARAPSMTPALVQVDGSYYAALPAPLYSEVHGAHLRAEIEILDADGAAPASSSEITAQGALRDTPEADRIFNPSRETARLIGEGAQDRPELPRSWRSEIFARLGRPGQKALYGLTNLAAPLQQRADIEAACERVLRAPEPLLPGAQAHPRARPSTEARAAADDRAAADGPAIRPIEDYQRFFESTPRDDHDSQILNQPQETTR